MKYRVIVLLGFLMIISFKSLCWDEVSHAYITRMAIEKIKNPELKNILLDNIDAFIYGSWFTDTYQYTDKRIPNLNPHILQVHNNAFIPYLQKPGVKIQENYQQLVAFYLGTIAHAIEDFWLDYNLYNYPKNVQGDKMTGDVYNGVINIKKHKYLTLQVKREMPVKDLFAIYKEAGLLEEGYSNLESFSEMMNTWSNEQYLMLRALKLLSFLASNQISNISPWTAANFIDAPGGMRDCADKVAKLVEASWKRVEGESYDAILDVNYIWMDQSLGILTSFEANAEKIPRKNCFLIEQDGDTIFGRVEQMKYNKSNLNRSNVVLKFFPDVDFIENEHYTFHLLPGEYGDHREFNIQKSYEYQFQAIIDDEMLNNRETEIAGIFTMRTGVFLFIPFIGIAGIFWGFPGIISFFWCAKHRYKRMPLLLIITKALLLLAGLVTAGIGFYLLFTQGWYVIQNV